MWDYEFISWTVSGFTFKLEVGSSVGVKVKSGVVNRIGSGVV